MKSIQGMKREKKWWIIWSYQSISIWNVVLIHSIKRGFHSIETIINNSFFSFMFHWIINWATPIVSALYKTISYNASLFSVRLTAESMFIHEITPVQSSNSISKKYLHMMKPYNLQRFNWQITNNKSGNEDSKCLKPTNQPANNWNLRETESKKSINCKNRTKSVWIFIIWNCEFCYCSYWRCKLW